MQQTTTSTPRTDTPRHRGPGDADAEVDVRRLGLATLDGRRRAPGVRVPLRVAALLAEADRALRGTGLHLLVLGSTAPGDVEVTLADRAGEPAWMGALPTSVDVDGIATSLPTGPDRGADARRRALAAAMSAVGFVRGTTSWFAWSAPRTV